MLIMDQKVTTQAILGELDDRGVKFATLRMRSPALMKHINTLTSKDFKQITLDRAGGHNKPRVHETAAVKLTSYPGTVRLLVITGLGRDQPTVLITNDTQITTKALIAHYARRMTIEQRLAEIIQAFCADALSSAVNLNVDLNVVLCVLAQALTAAFRLRLPGNYAHATPDTLRRRFLDTPGEIISDDTGITVKINRRACRSRASPGIRGDISLIVWVPALLTAAISASSSPVGRPPPWARMVIPRSHSSTMSRRVLASRRRHGGSSAPKTALAWPGTVP